jgi:hypothetical protein
MLSYTRRCKPNPKVWSGTIWITYHNNVEARRVQVEPVGQLEARSEVLGLDQARVKLVVGEETRSPLCNMVEEQDLAMQNVLHHYKLIS